MRVPRGLITTRHPDGLAGLEVGLVALVRELDVLRDEMGPQGGHARHREAGGERTGPPAIEMGADDAGAARRTQLDLARPEGQDGALRVEIVAGFFAHHVRAQDVLERARGGTGVGHRHLDTVHSLEHV